MRTTPQGRLVSRLGGALGGLAFVGLKLLGVEVPRSVKIGRGFRLAHGGVGVVVHQYTVIGDNVVLYQGVTLGRGDQYLLRSEVDDDPEKGGRIVVGNGVVVGANAVVLFKVGQTLELGDGAIIGANSTVLESVPAGEIWAGSPAKRIGVNPHFEGGE